MPPKGYHKPQREAKHTSLRPKPRELSGRKRIPLSGRDVLAVKGYDAEEGEYVVRVFNDDPQRGGRIERAKEAGWEPVLGEGQLGDPTLENVRAPGAAITRPVGGGITGVLMRKRRDEYEEDMALVREKADNIEEAIFGEIEPEGRYGRIEAFGRTAAKE